MRTLPAGIPISDTITRPVWLLTLEFPSGTVRYSSRETVTISSVEYTAAGFSVTQYAENARGAVSATVRIPSHDGALRALVFNDDWRGQPATLSMIYGESGWDSSDIVVKLSGVMNDAPSITEHVELTLFSDNYATEFSPRHFVRPPTFNHIPPAGAVISWSAETVRLPGR